MECQIKKKVSYNGHTKDWYDSTLIIHLFTKKYYKKKEYDYLAGFALIDCMVIGKEGSN